MQLKKTFKSRHSRDTVFPPKNPDPPPPPLLHWSNWQGWYWRDAFCFLFRPVCIQDFLMREWRKAEIRERGSGRMFYLEWWCWKANGSIRQCQWKWVYHKVLWPLGNRLLRLARLASFMMETIMCFQAPAGCSAITALLQRWPFSGIKMNDWFHCFQIFFPIFPGTVWATLMKSVTMPFHTYGFNNISSRRSLVAMRIYSCAYSDGRLLLQLGCKW